MSKRVTTKTKYQVVGIWSKPGDEYKSVTMGGLCDDPQEAISTAKVLSMLEPHIDTHVQAVTVIESVDGEQASTPKRGRIDDDDWSDLRKLLNEQRIALAEYARAVREKEASEDELEAIDRAIKEILSGEPVTARPMTL